MAFAAHNLSRRSGVVAFAVLAAVVFAPGRADAGCGDYVHIAGDPTADTAPDPHAGAPVPVLPAQPCHGPNCSNRPPVPDPPLSAPVTDGGRPKESAAHPGEWIVPAAGLGGWHVPAALGTPVARPVPVFHPPPG